MPFDLSHLIVAVLAGGFGAMVMRRRQPASPTVDLIEPQMRDEDRLGGFEQVFTILFLGGWLIAWTFALFSVGAMLLSGATGIASVFLLGWLIAAVAGWFAAMHTLVRALQGKRAAFSRRG